MSARSYLWSSTITLAAVAVLLPHCLQAQPALQGTLFTNAEQRSYLDFLREDYLRKNQQEGFYIDASLIPDLLPTATDSQAATAQFTLSGIVRRGDGSMRVWLNNLLLAENELPSNARLVRDGATWALQFVTDNGPRLLRPGQTLALDGTEVQERYQRPVAATVVEATSTTSAPAALDEAVELDQTDVGTADAQNTDSTDTGAATVTTTVAGELDPDAAINSLPSELRQNPDSLDSMIQTLQTLREQVVVEDDE